ncbi:MAG: hypothetical protein FJ044_05310, partial [Candidatus Cloacimonetes bacterium]|nr:hypothetical protein [Candidatus Cloacimonadota bacterium]
MQKQKGFSSILIIVIIALLVIGATGLVVYLQAVEPGTDQSQKLIACAQDAKQCPDGSYVSRVPPNCSFAPCPEVQDETVDWKTY